MKLCSFLFFIIVLVPFTSFAQSISPLILNNGGGSAISMEWNMGESVSITNFSNNGYNLNTGGLQPLNYIVTAIDDYGPAVFGNQITIGPNPTINLLRLKARFNEAGNLSMQLIDAKSAIIFNQDAGTIFSSFERAISIEGYPSGLFYLKIYFKPIFGNIKTGIYKIIKL